MLFILKYMMITAHIFSTTMMYQDLTATYTSTDLRRAKKQSSESAKERLSLSNTLI